VQEHLLFDYLNTRLVILVLKIMSSSNSIYQPRSILKKILSPMNSSRHDLSSTSEDELPVRHNIRPKKTYSRPLVVIETSSSSSESDERINKQFIDKLKTTTTLGYPTIKQQGDMSLTSKDNRT